MVPQSASPMHIKPPLTPHDRGTHDLSSPMPMPSSSGLPVGIKTPPVTANFDDFDNSDSETRSSLSKPIDDPMLEIIRLRKLLEEKDRHIATIDDAKVKLLKQSMENTTRLRQLEGKTSAKAVMESDEFNKKVNSLSAKLDSKELITLKLNKEIKELCLKNERLKDEVADKSSILLEYKRLCDGLEEEVQDLKQGGGNENREREALLEKMIDEIAHLNVELDQSRQEIEELKLDNSIQAEDSAKEVEYLQGLLQTEEVQRRTDDEVVVDVLSQMENARLSKFIYSLIKMDGKDVLDIQDLIVLLESGTVSMRRRHKERPPSDDEVNDENAASSSNVAGSSSSKKAHFDKSADSSSGTSGGTLDLNVEKTCIVRLMDFLNDEQLVEVGGYLKEFFHYSPDFEPTKISAPGKSGGKQVHIDDSGGAGTDEHVCFTITRNDGEEEVWMELVDASTNLKYYHNPDLNLTQWELPSEIQSYLNKEHREPKD